MKDEQIYDQNAAKILKYPRKYAIFHAVKVIRPRRANDQIKRDDEPKYTHRAA